MELSIFFEEQTKLLQSTSTKLVRSLYDEIDWKKKCIGIFGERGAGKTTLVLQHLKKAYKNTTNALYISVDTPFFRNSSLLEFAHYFDQMGGELLCIDEIHKYDGWAQELKEIHDHTSLKVIIIGFSIPAVHEACADLCSRVDRYFLSNLSYREYLAFRHGISLPVLSVDTIFADPIKAAEKISADIKPLEHFADYLQQGCYPYLLKGCDTYTQRMIQNINHIMESDMTYVQNINCGQMDKLKKLIYLIALQAPLTPNISQLAQETGLSRVTIVDYLYAFDNASIINTLSYKTKSTHKTEKPDRIYMHNTNLIRPLTYLPNRDDTAESFLVNQIKNCYENKPSFLKDNIRLTHDGDFIIENIYTVEFGKKGAEFVKAKELQNAYLIIEEAKSENLHEIPLWLFGFLY